jgi:hypothetical protein
MLLGIALTALTLTQTGCQAVASATVLGMTQQDADGIMPIDKNPPSVGYRRLKAYEERGPAMKFFFQAKGYPDYIIEKRVGLSVIKFVCYYPKQKVAYLIELNDLTKSVKTFGPEKMGDKDVRLFNALNEVKKAASDYQPKKGAAQ